MCSSVWSLPFVFGKCELSGRSFIWKNFAWFRQNFKKFHVVYPNVCCFVTCGEEVLCMFWFLDTFFQQLAQREPYSLFRCLDCSLLVSCVRGCTGRIWLCNNAFVSSRLHPIPSAATLVYFTRSSTHSPLDCNGEKIWVFNHLRMTRRCCIERYFSNRSSPPKSGSATQSLLSREVAEFLCPAT